MAKRRTKRQGLGYEPEYHQKHAEDFRKKARNLLEEAYYSAKNGDCSRALTALDRGSLHAGAHAAHAASSHRVRADLKVLRDRARAHIADKCFR